MTTSSKLPLFVLSTFAFAGALFAQTAPISFKAGNILVNDPDTQLIEEYTPNGTFIRAFGFDSDLDNAEQMVVGPHGVLYVSCYSPGKVLMYDGQGTQIDEMIDADLSSGRGLTIGPSGIYVSSYFGDRVVEFDFFGNKKRSLGVGTALNAPVGLTFGPGGRLFVGSNIEKIVHEFDVDGRWLRSFGNSDQPHCSGLAVGPDGQLWVGSYSDASVMRFDAEGLLAAETVLGGNGLDFFEITPAGNLMASNGFSVRYLDVNGDMQFAMGGGHSSSGTFVPFRFKAQLSGVITETGLAARKINVKKSAVITYWPAQGRASIQFEVFEQSDLTPAILDLFNLVNTTTMVFQGDESRASATSKGRNFVGTYHPQKSMENGIGALSIGLTGKVVQGVWRPAKASGSFNFSRNGKTFRGVIKSKGLLNG